MEGKKLDWVRKILEYVRGEIGMREGKNGICQKKKWNVQ